VSEGKFSSRWGTLVVMLGMAVGTGNIWRFPREAANNGGGSFLIPWVIFLLLWSVPLLLVEFAMGRAARRGPIGAFAKLFGKGRAWMGAWVAFTATAIMFYYSVVAGWCLYYLAHSITAALPAHTGEAKAVWDELQGGYAPVWCHLLAIGGCGLAAYKGVSSIEKANQILVPTLVIVVLVSVLRALTLPGAYPGVQFLFTPEWASLARPRVWLEALTQNAWDTGAGWGLQLGVAAGSADDLRDRLRRAGR
jgi:NSS family neurotransmitter:Na+ symporter